MLRIVCLVLLLTLCACERFPESYPPPEQRHPVEGPNPDPSAMMVNMSDPDAPLHFVKDIDAAAGGGGLWRWTGQQPTVRVLAYKTENLKLRVEFTLWPVAFEQTGPVELTFAINGRVLDKVRYASPGYKRFEKSIPSDFLSTDEESNVSIAIDKMYVAPEDKKKFGFILTSVGFVQ